MLWGCGEFSGDGDDKNPIDTKQTKHAFCEL